MRKQRVWLGVLLVVAFLLGGCAAGGMDDVEESGFLVDYSQLTPGGEDRAALTYVDPEVDFKNYDALMFDRVSVWLSPEAENRDVDPAVFKKMSDYFLNALVKAVEDGYTVVDQPGPNVIRVRAAITDVEPSDPVAKALSVDNIGTGDHDTFNAPVFPKGEIKGVGFHQAPRGARPRAFRLSRAPTRVRVLHERGS